jgi:GT2 family glycosyltransferase
MSLETASPKVWVGFIVYGASTAPYLSYFLQSLKKQTHISFQVVCFDNTPSVENENSELLAAHPEIKIYRGEGNIGFSAAYNILISEAVNAGATYFFVVNPDTILEPEVIDQLISTLENSPHCASVAPKLLKWNFTAKIKTSVIDSCGVVLKSGLKFSDLGQGHEDHGQFDQLAILGPSGAAGMFRLKALQAIVENDNYFDEYFFMYKEDCDLIYRLHLAGYNSQLVSSAIMYHDRTVTGGGVIRRFFDRRSRSKAINRFAFINQHWLYVKYWRRQIMSSKLLILVGVCTRFFQALIFEQYLLGAYRVIYKGYHFLKKY